MKHLTLPSLFFAVALVAPRAFSQTVASSSFDADTEGWVGTTPGVTWGGAEGNPGGFLRFDDPGAPSTAVLAPAAYLGDWTSLDGSGCLSMEFRVLSYSAGCVVSDNHRFEIRGPGGSARWRGAVVEESGWHAADAPIRECEWALVSGTWSALLADVQALEVQIELVDNTGPCGNQERTGIDNVRLGVGCPALISPYCFGRSCPCANDAGTAGCRNSTGAGAGIQAVGSSSVAADDLVVTVSSVPPNRSGLLFMGGGRRCPSPFGDGLLCVGAGGASLCRFPVQDSGPQGVLAAGPGIAAFSQALQPACNIAAGQTWNFQGWYRDSGGPCASGFSLSNALGVTFAP